MEVTRKNFKDCLPLINESINKADFLVIDAEFTGLSSGRDVSMFDSPQEYYNALLNGSTEFLLIQYGLCAFYWNEKYNHYMNDAYNFYLFPRGRPGPDKLFLCQSSSLDFLASQGFDFNKLIKEGISYVTEPVEIRLRENLMERQKTVVVENITIPEENKQQVEEACKKVRAFLDDDKEDGIDIDRCNAFVRRLLFQELGNRFKNEVFVETKTVDNNRVLKVYRIKSAADRQNKDSEKKEKEFEEIEDAVGFSKVARMISQSQKLVIGHNMLLDVIHTLNHFFQPLPVDYLAFKEFTHCMFPRILDTKYMSSLPPFKDKVNSSVLQHLLATLAEPPFSLPKADSEEGRGYRQGDDKLHEAGYDAYVTGLCYLAMHQHLETMRGDRPGKLPGPDCATLKPFLNKLFLAKTAHQDSPFINLTGRDPTPPRDHVFHLTFPKEWQRNDISQLFSAFGPITVQFMDDTTAMVGLSRRDQARHVASAFANNTRVSLVPYASYKMRNVRMQHPPVEQPRPPPSAMMSVNSPDLSRLRQGSVPKPAETSATSRSPSNSVSSASVPMSRKRASFSVFQVDKLEPQPKKQEVTRSNSDHSRTRPESISNGRRKAKTERGDSGKWKEKIEIFDSTATTNCVAAFKESDAWD